MTFLYLSSGNLKSEAVEQAVDNAGGFDLDEWSKAHAPESVPDRRPWFFKTVMGRGLVCLLTKVIPILLPVVWLSLVVMGMLPNPLALFDFFSTDPQPSLLNPANGCFWLLLTMFIVAVLHDSLPSLLRRLGWMMDEPKTASASLTSMVESHYGVSNLEVDWFGAAAGGVPPFDGLYSCCYDTGRRKNNGVLRVRNHRVWLYGPDGCEEERHEHRESSWRVYPLTRVNGLRFRASIAIGPCRHTWKKRPQEKDQGKKSWRRISTRWNGRVWRARRSSTIWTATTARRITCSF